METGMMSSGEIAALPASAQSADGFAQWLAGRLSALDRPARDADGVLLRPGTPVLIPDQTNPSVILRDTPQNRQRMRTKYEAEVKSTAEVAEKERRAALAKIVEAEADRLLARNNNCILPGDILDALRGRHGIDIGRDEIRSMLLEMQRAKPERYALCVNGYGDEELRLSEYLGECRRVEA